MLIPPKTSLQAMLVHRGVNRALSHEGLLTDTCLIAMSGGDGARYETDSFSCRVTEGACLLLNAGTRRGMRIESCNPVSSFLLRLPIKWIQQALAVRSGRPEAWLEPSALPDAEPFLERLHPDRESTGWKFRALREGVALGYADGWLEEATRGLIESVIDQACCDALLVRRVDAVRRTTQQEITRRLFAARDYIHAHFCRSVSLEDVASASAMSPHYLLRSFQTAFGKTPHAYQVELRLEYASELLGSTTLSVSDVCRAVGYQSAGSFSNLFRRSTGLSPVEFRRAVAGEFSNIR